MSQQCDKPSDCIIQCWPAWQLVVGYRHYSLYVIAACDGNKIKYMIDLPFGL